MNKILRPMILAGVCLIGILAACTLPLVPAPSQETETAIPTANPTETATPVVIPTASATPVFTTPVFAPSCAPDAVNLESPTQCQLPIAEVGSTFCTKKVPYNLLFINAGATYEVLTENFKCSDAGKKDGRQIVTCSGPMASAFEVRVCDPVCVVPTLQTEITQCPQGFYYNNLQGCCAQEPLPASQSCVVLILETTSCVVDCSEYTTKSSCENNFYACEWNDVTNECQMRR